MKRHLHRLGAAAVSGALLASLLTACGGGITAETPSVVPESPAQQTEQAVAETRTVTDAAGNVVEVPAELSRIAVTPLPWSSVIYAIDGTSEHMVSINPGAMTAYTNCFFSKLDSGYAELDTTSIGSDFSINMEEMVSRGVQAVVIWDYQTEEAEQLKALGITPVMVKNETIEDLQASFTAIGQMLGKEERAEQFNTLYTEAYEYLQSFQEQVNAADKPKVLYLRNAELKLQGNDMFIAEALELELLSGFEPETSSLPTDWENEISCVRALLCPFPSGDPCSPSLLSPLFPPARFPVWVSVWVSKVVPLKISTTISKVPCFTHKRFFSVFNCSRRGAGTLGSNF